MSHTLKTTNYFLFSCLLYISDLKEVLTLARQISKFEKQINSKIWNSPLYAKKSEERFDLIATQREYVDLLKLKWTKAISDIATSAHNNIKSIKCHIGDKILLFAKNNKAYFDTIKEYRNIRSHYLGNENHSTTKIISDLLEKNNIVLKNNSSGFVDILLMVKA